IISSPATRSRRRSAAPLMDGSISASRQQRLHNPVPSQARCSSQRGLVMMTRTALAGPGPGAAGAFEIRQKPRRNPAADEVAITVAAASVNPIDVRRAEGYGLRLLSLLGAGKFPIVLGNDFVGTVASVGAQVSTFKPGDRVYGVK